MMQLYTQILLMSLPKWESQTSKTDGLEIYLTDQSIISKIAEKHKYIM